MRYIDKYFFFAKNADGTYTYFGKVRKTKPFWSFGIRACIGSICSIVLAFLTVFEITIVNGLVTYFTWAMLTTSAMFFIFTDMAIYKRL